MPSCASHWKSLSLQVVPWCFHMAADHAHRHGDSDDDHHHHHHQQRQKERRPHEVRVLGADGRVRVFRRAVTAGELMADHPCHLVCRADALLIGRKIPALQPAEALRPGQSYFLLPAHLADTVLSFVSLASALLNLLAKDGAAGKGSHGGGGLICKQPFEIERTAEGALQIRVSEDLLHDQEDNKDNDDDELLQQKKARRLCSTEKLEKEYDGLVAYAKSRQWRPKLDTIAELCLEGQQQQRRRQRGLPFLMRMGSSSRRRRSEQQQLPEMVN